MGNIAQIQSLQVNFNYSQTSQYQVADNGGRQIGRFSSAVTISLSVSAINITTGGRAAEQLINNTRPATVSAKNSLGSKAIETALKDLLKEIKGSNALTGKIVQRLAKLVHNLNVARGTTTNSGTLGKNARQQVHSARQTVNDFFQQKHSTTLTDKNLAGFIKLASKLESLLDFALKTKDLLSALKVKGTGNTVGGTKTGAETETETETETENKAPPPQVNIKA